jgi:GDP-4-dehydro-6-deoxy-D-mannose reductase
VRALVTGAGGFVGGHLVPRLRADGHEVVATDRELDVCDAAAVADRVAALRPDVIVHLAALSSVAASWRDPAATYRINYLGSRSVLRAAAGARVLWIGSADEYGSASPGARPFTEAAPLRPHSPYARSKAAADLLGATYAERGLDLVRVRAFNHAGPGQSPDFVLASFAKQLAEIEAGRREPVLRVGNLDSVRDFLDIHDVIEAYLRLLDPAVPAGVYNVASGVGARVGEHLDALLSRTRVKPRIEVDPERMRPADYAVGDASRLRRVTGWQPGIPMADTLARVLDHWRDRVSAA